MSAVRCSKKYVAWIFSVIIPLSIHAQTFDEAVVAVYAEKPYLYGSQDDFPVKTSRKKAPLNNSETTQQEDPIITWESIERSIDMCALGYGAWRVHKVYQLVYGDSVKVVPDQENTLARLVHFLTNRMLPTWALAANNHRRFGVETAMTLAEVYFYRTLAQYSLMGIRYGIVKPISWIFHSVKTLCLC